MYNRRVLNGIAAAARRSRRVFEMISEKSDLLNRFIYGNQSQATLSFAVNVALALLPVARPNSSNQSFITLACAASSSTCVGIDVRGHDVHHQLDVRICILKPRTNSTARAADTAATQTPHPSAPRMRAASGALRQERAENLALALRRRAARAV